MSGLPKPTPDAQILELTRRLAEDYLNVPLPEVSRIVKDVANVAAAGSEWAGTAEGIAPIVEVIEILAREELDVLSKPTPPTAGPNPPTFWVGRQRGQRQDAE